MEKMTRLQNLAITFNGTGLDDRTINAIGSFVAFKSSTSAVMPITVQFDDRETFPFTIGDRIKTPDDKPYGKVKIHSAGAQTVNILVGEGDFDNIAALVLPSPLPISGHVYTTLESAGGENNTVLTVNTAPAYDRLITLNTPLANAFQNFAVGISPAGTMLTVGTWDIDVYLCQDYSGLMPAFAANLNFQSAVEGLIPGVKFINDKPGRCIKLTVKTLTGIVDPNVDYLVFDVLALPY